MAKINCTLPNKLKPPLSFNRSELSQFTKKHQDIRSKKGKKKPIDNCHYIHTCKNLWLFNANHLQISSFMTEELFFFGKNPKELKI